MQQDNALLPGLGGKPPSRDAIRRAGIAEALSDFTKVCRGFSGSARVIVPEGETGRRIAMAMQGSPKFRDDVVELMAAIFALRLIRTRAKMEEDAREVARITGVNFAISEVEKFASAGIARLDAMHAEKFHGREVVGGVKESRALAVYMDGAAAVVFRSLYVEMDDEWRPKGITHNTSVEEADFWRSIFLGIADTDPGNCVARGFGVIYLDHAQDYAQAVADDNAAAVRSSFRVVDPA